MKQPMLPPINLGNLHCLKSFRIWSFSGLNAGKYGPEKPQNRPLLRSAAEEFGGSNIKLGVLEERLLSLLLFLKLNGR